MTNLTSELELLAGRLPSDQDASLVLEAADKIMELSTKQAVLQRMVDNLDAQVGAMELKVDRLREGLERYADKNFWIRVPAYSLAAADLGEIARDALREGYEDGNA